MTHFDANMRNLKEFQVEKSSKCKHNRKNSNLEYWPRNYEKICIENSFAQPIRRSRMFSPSDWVTNVKEFCQQVLKNRKERNFKFSNEENFKAKSNKEIKDWWMMNQEQFDMMKKIHSDLIDKTSKLVDHAKKSQFLGFFSPRRLRNRIKIGNFSQIAWSPAIVKRRAFSPSIRYPKLNNKSGTIDYDDKKQRNNSFYDAQLTKPSYQNSDKKENNMDCKLYKYQDSQGGKTLNINEEFIWTQQAIKHNFRLPSKFILD